MELRRLEASEHGAWDELVGDSPEGTLFHTAAWHRAFDVSLEVYGLFDGGRLVAGAALAPSRRFGVRIGRSGPLTPYGGPVIERQAGKRETRLSGRKRLTGALVDGLTERFTALSFRLPPGVRDVQPYLWRGFTADVRYTYLADVADLDEAWSALASQRRRNVRKAEEKGFSVIRSDDVDTLVTLVEASFDRKAEDPGFLSDLERVNRDPELGDRLATLLAVDASGRPLAAANVAWDESSGYYLAGGFDPSAGESAASALVVWEAMRLTSEDRGVGRFDFDGSMIPGVERFFRKFGGRLVPRFEVKWSPLHHLFG